MATIEELQAQLAALTDRVDAITAPPETYYTMQYQGETIDRLLSMAPDNLLDNVNFCNPVNQRGVSGTISTPGFFIDRWYLVSGSVQLTSAGLVLNGTMRQTREFAVGAPTTASALTTTGVVSATYDDSTKIFTLTGTGQTFITAKLELGNVSTVGYQNSNGVWVPTKLPKYADEFAACRRYLYSASPITGGTSQYGHFASLYATSGNTLSGIMYAPTVMRATPSATLVNGQYLSAIPIGSESWIEGNASEINVYSAVGTSLFVNVSFTSSSFTTGENYQLRAYDAFDCKIIFDAEI